MNQHKRAWIYCRIANSNIMALESQKQRLLDSAEKQGFEIAGITTEMASGRSIKRQGMSEVFTAAKEWRMDTLFVLNSSRITRTTGELFDCIKKLNKYGIEILASDAGVVRLPGIDLYTEIAESMTD